jgi:hypothetical protein
VSERAALGLFDFMRPAAAVGAAGILISLIELFIRREQFFRSWLYAWLFVLGIALGAMGMVMLQHLVVSEWGLLIRRIGEAAALTLPVLLLLGVPLLLGLRDLFPWAGPDEVARDAVLNHRRPLFDVSNVLIRAAVYFAVWMFFAWRMRAVSLRLDTEPTDARVLRLRRLSAAGMVLYFLTMSSAAVDWIMSLEPNWYSTIFGFILIIAQGLSATAFLTLIVALLSRDPPMDTAARPDLLHDLGNLLMMMVVLWAYLSFAQLLVIWLGNTQDEIPWYVHRSKGVWRFITVLLVLFQFFGPFILLLMQGVKRDPRTIAWVTGGILFMQWLNILWMIEPSSATPEPHGLSWVDFVTPIGIGGIWFASFLWLLRRRPLLPLGLSVAVQPFAHGPNDDDDDVPTTSTVA